MSDLAHDLLTKTYAGYLSQSVLSKFTNGIVLERDISQAVAETLTERLQSVVVNPNADLGMYASKLAISAMIDLTPNPDTKDAFTRVRQQALVPDYENVLSAYAWDSTQAAAQSLVLYNQFYESTNAFLGKCRDKIDQISVVQKNPIEVALFGWGALSDGAYANYALGTLVQRTNQASPAAGRIAMALREELEFFDAQDASAAAALYPLYAQITAENEGVDLPTSGRMAEILATFKTYLASYTAGIIDDTIAACESAMVILSLKTVLDERVDALADDQKELISDYVSKLIRLVTAVFGAIAYQRGTIFADAVVLHLSAASGEHPPMVVINADHANLLDDLDRRKMIVQGMCQFLENRLEIPPRGLSVEYVEKTLPFYASQASRAIEANQLSDDANTVSRVKAALLPRLVEYFSEQAAILSPEQSVGNIDAYANQMFIALTAKDGVSAQDVAIRILCGFTHNPMVIGIADVVKDRNVSWKEAASSVFIDNLITDFFVSE